MSHALAEYGILSGANMEEKIGTDVLGSLQYYQTMFGNIPQKEIKRHRNSLLPRNRHSRGWCIFHGIIIKALNTINPGN